MGAVEISEWLRRDAVRFPEVDPDDVPDEALTPLLDFVGSARVLALGESMHRTHEFPAWRNRLLRFLVDHAGFTAVVLESGFPESAAVERWIDNGEGRLRPLLDDGITYHFGKSQESLDLVTHLRERRVRGGSRVRFYGMDVPDSASSALPALRQVVDFLDRFDPSYAEHVRATLRDVSARMPTDRSGLAWAALAIQSHLALSDARRHALTSTISGLVERLRARATDLRAAGADAEDLSRIVRVAEIARSTDAFLAAMAEGPTRTWPAANIRDLAMADTVEWILERESRILVYAANGHVRRTPYTAPPIVVDPLPTVGTHLAARLGSDLRVLGTTFGDGELWMHRPAPTDPPGHSTPFIHPLGPPGAETLDALLAAGAQGPFFVDLRTAPGAVDSATGTLNGPEVEPADVRASYDGILHVGTISPWHTWIDARGRWD